MRNRNFQEGKSMKAMLLEQITNLKENPHPLSQRQVPTPQPGPQDVLIKVLACGVCHTELDEIEGRTPPPDLPVILGHQVVGEVVARGSQAHTREMGARVGVAWIYSSCGHCEYCLAGEENLCPEFIATGRDVNGGYAEYMIAPESYTYPIPEIFTDAQAAPHLCAGAIGYRSLRLTGLKNGQRLGLTGFGASGHLVLKMIKERFPDTDVYVFSRNPDERHFAQELGAVWAGEIEASSPEKLHAIIDTTPVWKPVVEALKNLAPGGRLVINAIRKESVDQDALLKLDYPAHLWMEKEIKSVANVARRDVQEFLELAAQVPILPEVQEFALEDANQALLELRTSKIRGAKVLRVA
jgi:propanol-preferring alcohol dehydrogenase